MWRLACQTATPGATRLKQWSPTFHRSMTTPNETRLGRLLLGLIDAADGRRIELHCRQGDSADVYVRGDQRECWTTCLVSGRGSTPEEALVDAIRKLELK